jgi:hypothetical protein
MAQFCQRLRGEGRIRQRFGAAGHIRLLFASSIVPFRRRLQRGRNWTGPLQFPVFPSITRNPQRRYDKAMAHARRWRIIAGITALAVTVIMMPAFAGNDAHHLLLWSYILTGLWFIALVIAVIRFKRRGLVLLIGAPIVIFWPVAFRLMEYACSQNANACL